MDIEPTRPVWVEIDRGALANNVRQLRRVIGPRCQLAGVVKANAYGHGALPVSTAILAAGADRLAVATLSEALELRAGGVRAPILVLGYTPARQAAEVVRHGVAATVYDLPSAQALGHAAVQQGAPAMIHVKVNTGMNRLGVEAAQAASFVRALHAIPGLDVEGVFTHFATSDTDRRYTLEQTARFRAVISELEAAGLRPPLVHAANSAATLTLPETHFDMVRCGIALYGLDPDDEITPIPPDFRPVLAWKAQVAQVRTLAPGQGVSYGLEFVAQRTTTLAVIPLGYADGFPRRPLTWGSVLIHGCPAPITGRVCMDQTIVDVTDIVAAGERVRQGDEVALIGRQGGAAISAEEAARRIGTINYDVVSRIQARVPRLMVGETA